MSQKNDKKIYVASSCCECGFFSVYNEFLLLNVIWTASMLIEIIFMCPQYIGIYAIIPVLSYILKKERKLYVCIKCTYTHKKIVYF